MRARIAAIIARPLTALIGICCRVQSTAARLLSDLDHLVMKKNALVRSERRVLWAIVIELRAEAPSEAGEKGWRGDSCV